MPTLQLGGGQFTIMVQWYMEVFVLVAGGK